MSIFLYFLISDFPEDAEWLTQEEKEFVKTRLYEDVGHSKRDESLTLRRILNVFKDCEYSLECGCGWRAHSANRQGYCRRLHVLRSDCSCIWLWCVSIVTLSLFSTSQLVPLIPAYFAPTIIKGLGHSNIRTQLYSVPPWACAFVFSMINAVFSDYFGHRFLFVVIPIFVAITGFIILLAEHSSTNVEYLGCFFAVMGTYTSLPIIVCWFNTNRKHIYTMSNLIHTLISVFYLVGGHDRRAVGTAWQVGFGNSAL